MQPQNVKVFFAFDSKKKGVHCMKGMVSQQLQEEHCEFFTILSDESKDAGKKEQGVVAVRCRCHRSSKFECRWSMKYCFDLLQRFNANMMNCVGLWYHDASVVLEHLNGVQRKIPERTGAPMAYYDRCFCHCLNLVIVDIRPFAPSRNRALSLSMSCNCNIVTGTNTS